MTVSTLRPSSTSVDNGISITGAASSHAALSDDSDASYITCPTNASTLVFMSDLTLPAGAAIKSARMRARCAKVSTNSVVEASWLLPTDVEVVTEVTWATPTTIGGSTVESLDAGGLTDSDFDSAQVLVRNRGGVGNLRVYEVYLDATYVLKPTTAALVGTTITDTNLPQVTWTNTFDADGGAQTAFEVKVFTDAQYLAGGFDASTSTPHETSGIVNSSSASWTPSTLQPDDTYRAYVRVAQTVAGALHWSDRAFDEYVVNVDLPAVPAIVVTAESYEARHRIELTALPDVTSTDLFELQASYDGGTTWAPVRGLLAGGIVTPDPGATIVYDWEAPNGIVATYRARALHNYSGLYAASGWATDSDTWASTSWWFKHPLDPELNMPVVVHSQADRARAARQGSFQALGATYPVVISDTRAAPTGTIVLRTDSAADQALLDDLLDSAGALLVQAPQGEHWPDRYVRFADHGRARIFDKAFIEPVFDTLPWQEVASPVGVITEYPSDAS